MFWSRNWTSQVKNQEGYLGEGGPILPSQRGSRSSRSILLLMHTNTASNAKTSPLAGSQQHQSGGENENVKETNSRRSDSPKRVVKRI